MARLRYVFGAGARSGVAALSDVSFSVTRGEVFGIVGANGSGKSTLLKILAGIIRPSRGSAEVRGRLSALLELGAGFSPEFTGRENVYLNASLFGLEREETAARFESIERFAEIGEFIDQPVRTYSSGMVLRLAFAVSAHVDPEILIVDEALAVGDIAFRQRCMRRIHELRTRGTTILFVSHDASDVKALCDRCLWLERGRVRQTGAADEVVANYLQDALHRTAIQTADARNPVAPALASRRFGDRTAEVIASDLVTPSGEPARELRAGKPVAVNIRARAHARVESPIVGFLLRNEKGESVFGANTANENYPLAPLEPGGEIALAFHWTPPALAAGRYSISVAIADGDESRSEIRDYVEDAITVEAPAVFPPVHGYLRLECEAVSVTRS